MSFRSPGAFPLRLCLPPTHLDTDPDILLWGCRLPPDISQNEEFLTTEQLSNLLLTLRGWFIGDPGLLPVSDTGRGRNPAPNSTATLTPLYPCAEFVKLRREMLQAEEAGDQPNPQTTLHLKGMIALLREKVPFLTLPLSALGALSLPEFFAFCATNTPAHGSADGRDPQWADCFSSSCVGRVLSSDAGEHVYPATSGTLCDLLSVCCNLHPPPDKHTLSGVQVSANVFFHGAVPTALVCSCWPHLPPCVAALLMDWPFTQFPATPLIGFFFLLVRRMGNFKVGNIYCQQEFPANVQSSFSRGVSTFMEPRGRVPVG